MCVFVKSDQLAEDLALWSTGLFPFVQYAATHVKPQLLLIFEQYYYPLRGKLRPAMRGFIISLLPALEEEGSEYFDRVSNSPILQQHNTTFNAS